MAYGAYGKKEEKDANVGELRSRISSGELDGSFVFYGEEDYLKRFYAKELLKTTEDIDLKIFDGELILEEFENAVLTVSGDNGSFFGENSSSRRAVKLFDVDFKGLSEKEGDRFISLISNLPPDTTVVSVFSSVYPKLNDKLLKRLCDASLTVNFPYEKDNAKLCKWVSKHFGAKKTEISTACAAMLIESVGRDMTSLSFEIDKLCAYCLQNGCGIDGELISRICTKNPDARAFDAINSALSGDFDASMRTMKILRAQRVEPLMIFGMISSTVSKLCTAADLSFRGYSRADIAKSADIKDFAVSQYLRIASAWGNDAERRIYNLACVCDETDAKLKGFGQTDGYAVIETALWRISQGL